jgi:regulatory protein
MSRITAIEADHRKQNRVLVRLESGRPLSLWRAVAAPLQLGQELDASEIAQIRSADAVEGEYQRALHLLGLRPRSESEIQGHLRRRGISQEDIDIVVSRLRASQLTDDKRFAETWVENRTAFRPRSRRTMAWELRQKGVGPQDIEHALAGVDDGEMALQAGLKYARRLRENPWPEFRRRLQAYLARRGFSGDITSTVVARAWEETTGGHPILENEEVP